MLLRVVILWALLSVIGCSDSGSSRQSVDYHEAVSNCDIPAPTTTITEIPCLVGARFPDFEVNSYDDQLIRSSIYAGQPLVVTIWSANCAVCALQIDGFNRLISEYPGANFLGLCDETKIDAYMFVEGRPWNMPHVPNAQSFVEGTLQLPWSVPLTIIIDREFRIVSAFTGGRIDQGASADLYARVSAHLTELGL